MTNSAYSAPIDDMLLSLKTVANLGDDFSGGVYGDLDGATIGAVLEEAGKFAADVLAPLYRKGDREGAKWSNGVVTTPEGVKEAYQQFVDNGWNSLACSAEFGGQALPMTVATAVLEMWNSGDMSFGLFSMLTKSAIEAIEASASDELKAKYLPKMVTGEWTGTMNLTEPHAGSDLSLIKTKAEAVGDGTYRITGTKMFITCGEQDLSKNIIHLVLARKPDAPQGTRGISLFLVPKFLVNEDGSLGAHNDVVCAGIEHKCGLGASPTCLMKYGEKGGAIGYLVGEENRGLAAMFVMMNQARLAVGVQGVAISERATQQAIAYAKERTQGRAPGGNGASMSPIIAHPDVRRNLMTMKALTQASRCICLATAAAFDAAQLAKDSASKAAAANLAALLTPVAKSYPTFASVEVAALGIQVHGGMGFIEETGAAQYLREACVLPIYEGTNGIQAIDLVTRKLPMEGGETVKAYFKSVDAVASKLEADNRPHLAQIGGRLKDGLAALERATNGLIKALASNHEQALAGATPYVKLFGLVAGARYLGEKALRSDASATTTETARFFADNLLPAAGGLADTVMDGGQSLLAAEEVFA